MRSVAIDVAAVVEQVVMGGYLALLVQGRGPVEEIDRPPDECADAMTASEWNADRNTSRSKRSIPRLKRVRAVENVLPVEQLFEPGETFRRGLSVRNPGREFLGMAGGISSESAGSLHQRA
jgi:hypothetical protein